MTNVGKNLPVCAGRKHDFVRRGVESGEKFLDQACFDSAGFARRDTSTVSGIN
jgi:hypothetical protein